MSTSGNDRRVYQTLRGTGLLLVCVVSFASAGHVSALPPGAWKDTPRAKWTILFRSDDPALWDTDTKGKAIPLDAAPAKFQFLRLRRMDTGDALILPIDPEDLTNGKPDPEARYWWNGTAKKDWEGRHLGIVQAPRHKFPAPQNMIGVMTEGWDAFTGAGFGHKCFVNDKQYYCWRGKEIRKTVFEIAVSDGPLSPEEKRLLLR